MSAPSAAGLQAFSLAGRRALVTGAGRGIGRALALGLAAAGAEIVLAGRPGSSDDTLKTLADAGAPATAVDLDLSRPADIGADLLDRLPGPVDVLVNNAGTITREDAVDVDLAAWSAVVDVNLTSLFQLTRAVAAPMLARGTGKVINVASLLSFQGGVRVASYAASKHAVAGLTRALANEWAPAGVQVNAIAPGYIETDNTAPLREDAQRRRGIDDRIPAGRWGRPEDLVGAAVFLASPAADYVNGHVLVVDGGWMAR
ncbi:MAG: 2-dehydro-3-deoxy-D-gluconate 5-dehydrogenase @ 2-deoxy-D-gluconate 3-dehydrogenase [uncultured Blastococcus sp.]|uniref:2-dehydro-3-deoxy-D-gluconate 5-dehydrogenase @ 2-deoxy-D-gluconate 3-dehydrogenase n=1 Tax=uncultured Blastococcus sp. TaxID=217144 RepID=A0A6J4HHZ6_9ACTN|nr:MAG: 2-dehydro-3-deoxy-D-gluconate 5-dehydrogenase @ 2-deoxy-D-gluconate 3-dehydrogenase [uncultured Blastococcus sp.]